MEIYENCGKVMLLSDYILELFGKFRKISESLGNRHSKKNASGRSTWRECPMGNRGLIGSSKQFLMPRWPMNRLAWIGGAGGGLWRL